MDAPWKSLAPVRPEAEYLVLLTYLPLKSYLKIPRFLLFTFQIQGQLNKTPGAIGYSLRAKILSCKFWTLSVWEDDSALTDFIVRQPHGNVMKALAPHLGATKFTRWKVRGSAVPVRWDDAMRHGSQES